MRINPPQLMRSVSWFTVVGAAAAVAHYVIAVTLEGLLQMNPAWANVMGFFFAFPVSYIGHHKFSFANHLKTHQHALPKFMLVAVFGFLANQTMVLLCLRFTALPFWLVLAVVMLLVAICTYLLSKHWAFSNK